MATASAPQLTRISVNSAGTEGSDDSLNASVSGDGRYVVFSSDAVNLVAGDTNGKKDIFLRDTQTNITTRISVDSAGLEGNGASFSPSMTGDGRYVLFSSFATNLVSGDTNGQVDLFIHDLQTGTTERVAEGAFIGSMSGDARYVAYSRGLILNVLDRQTGNVVNAAQSTTGGTGDRGLGGSMISENGQFVVFKSAATNLVANDTNNRPDIFVFDRVAETTTRVSVSSSGAQQNSFPSAVSISGDGRYVVFQSQASNLVAGDTNSKDDIFLHDRQTATTMRVSVSSTGVEANGQSADPAISADGRYITYLSFADNLVPGITGSLGNVFRYDVQAGTTSLVSFAAAGGPSAGSANAAISGNGSRIVFQSSATDIVAGDTNGSIDIFITAPLAVGVVDTRFTPNDDTVTLTNGVENIDALAGNDEVTGGTGDDIMNGNTGNDTLLGMLGNDTLNGADGDDRLMGGIGDDTLGGGAGVDTAFYNDATSAVSVSLNTSGAQNVGGGLGIDSLTGIENLLGSTFDDTLTGDANDNVLVGGDGNDTLDGNGTGSGKDVLYGGAGDDTYHVWSKSHSIDIVFEGGSLPGGAGDTDTIISHDDFFWDYYNVGEILSIASFAPANSTLVSGTGNTTMTGNGFDNFLLTYGGSNDVSPGAGIDVIDMGLYGLAAGMNGTNTVHTGIGDDTNYIYDFEVGKDKIDVTGYAGRFASGAEMVSNFTDASWGTYVWMGMHGGNNEFIAFVELSQAALDAADFMV